jgi:hypothetical protein
MRECFVHPFDRRCPDIAAFWHRLTQNYNGRNLFSNPNRKLGSVTPSRDLGAGLETNAVRPPNRIGSLPGKQLATQVIGTDSSQFLLSKKALASLIYSSRSHHLMFQVAWQLDEISGVFCAG